jgi:hypothetical protein
VHSDVAVKKEFLDTRDSKTLKQFESENPEKFKQLCYLFQNKYLLEFFEIKWHFKNRYLLKMIIRTFSLATTIALIYYCVLFVSLACYIKNYRTITKGLKKNHESLILLQEKAKISIVISQNCFNWARKYLKTLDIHLPEKPLERLLTIPELYLPKKTL